MKYLSLVLATITLGFAACAKKDATQTPQASAESAQTVTSGKLTNNELKIGISQEFENFNPLISSMAATSYMLRMTNRTLTVINADGHGFLNSLNQSLHLKMVKLKLLKLVVKKK